MKAIETKYYQASDLQTGARFIHRGCLWEVTGFHEQLLIARNQTESEGPEELELDVTTFVSVVTSEKHY